MKNFHFILLLSLASTGIYAQPDLRWGIAMKYEFLILSTPELDEVEYMYEPGKASAFTKLYPPEMRKLSGSFLSHIINMRSVTNHVGVFGTEAPSSIGLLTFEEALKRLANGKLERVGNAYFDLSSYSSVLTAEGRNVFLDGKPFIKDDVLVRPKEVIYTEDLNTGEMKPQVVEMSVDYEAAAAGVGFIEEWEYEKEKAIFNKDIKYISILEPSFDELDQSYRGLKYLMTLKSGKFNKTYLNGEGLVRKNIEYNVLFNLDFNDSPSDASYHGMARTSASNGYIEPNERYDFLLDIVAGVKSGQLSIYHYDPLDFNQNRLKKASVEEFFAALTIREKAQVEDLNTGKLKEVEIVYDMKAEDVVGLRFFEDWYVDPESLGMYKRVNGIVLLKEVRDVDTGLVKGVSPYTPFFIKLNTSM